MLLTLCAGNSPMNSPHKGQWCGALTFPLICTWINGWANNREAGDLRGHRAHYDIAVMILTSRYGNWSLEWNPFPDYCPLNLLTSALFLIIFEAEADMLWTKLDNTIAVDALAPCITSYQQPWYWLLTHRGRDNMAAISQTTLSNAFSWMKMLQYRLNFHWSLFPSVQLTISQHWFR